MSKYALIAIGILIALMAGSVLIYFLAVDGSPLLDEWGYVVGVRYVEPRHITGAAVCAIIGIALTVGGALWPDDRSHKDVQFRLLCPHCGARTEEGWVACPMCGADLTRRGG